MGFLGPVDELLEDKKREDKGKDGSSGGFTIQNVSLSMEVVEWCTHESKLNLALVSPSRPQVLIAARSGMAVGRRMVWDSIFYSVIICIG